MPYGDITLTEAENLLASWLADSAKVRFVSGELRSYITEAQRTWNALSGMYEAACAPIAVTAGTVFLDLPTVTAAENGYTILESDLLSPIEYHLLEKQDTAVWTGSEMFTLADLTTAIARRRDQFILDTLCRVDRVQLPATPLAPGVGEYELPDSTIGIVRATWLATDSSKITPLWRSSHWSVRSTRHSINGEQGLPRVYDMHSLAPPTLSVSPVPADTGSFDLLLVRSGAVNTTYLGIPDDFAWAVKWGALADLLGRDGPARDYARSLYCERRYRLGVAAMLNRQTVTDVSINGRPARFTTIDKLDSGRMYWQNRSGAPQYVAPVGSNLLVLADPTNATVSLEIRTVRNTPVTTVGSNPLQIGREYLDMILGYAAHLAMFKIGGTEFAATTHFANAMLDQAAELNARLKESAAFEEVRFGDQRPDAKQRGIRRATGATIGGQPESDQGAA